MYDVIARSLVFGVRNLDKVTDVTRHDEGRILATTGQFAKALKSAGQLNNTVGSISESAIENITKLSQNNKVLEKTLKGVNWASNNVNPLLIGAAAYRVAMSKDKLDAINNEVFGMTTMFGFEAAMKRGFNSKAWQQLINKIQNPKLKIVAKIAQGLLFVAGSIIGSTIGYKIGKKVNAKVKENAVKEISLNVNKETKKQEDNYEKDFFMPNSNKSLVA